jgi:hypothetical protein
MAALQVTAEAGDRRAMHALKVLHDGADGDMTRGSWAEAFVDDREN